MTNLKELRGGEMKHTCHWDGCEKECPPAMWGCKSHWFTLPKFLRDKIWKAYRPGQEIRKDPSNEYRVVAWVVQLWIHEFKQGRKLNEKEFCGPFLESIRRAASEMKTAEESLPGSETIFKENFKDILA